VILYRRQHPVLGWFGDGILHAGWWLVVVPVTGQARRVGVWWGDRWCTKGTCRWWWW